MELGLRPEVWPKPKKSDVQPIIEPEKPTKSDSESAFAKELEKPATKSDSKSAFGQEAPPTDCDTHAASDYDPQRKAPGISFDKIKSGLGCSCM